MRSLTWLKTAGFLVSLLPLGSSQSIQDLPPCSFECTLDAVSTTVCSSTDYPCLCRTSPSFITPLVKCLATVCSTLDAQYAVSVLSELCTSLKIPLASPSTSSVSSTTSPSTNTRNTYIFSQTAAPVAAGTTTHSTPITATSTPTTTSLSSIYDSSPTTAVNSSFTLDPSSPTPQLTASTNPFSLSDAAKVGLGLSIPIACGLLGFLAWFVNRRLRRKRMQDEIYSRAIGVHEYTGGEGSNGLGVLGWRLRVEHDTSLMGKEGDGNADSRNPRRGG